MFIFLFWCVCERVYVCVFVCVCLSVCMYAFVCMCLYVWVGGWVMEKALRKGVGAGITSSCSPKDLDVGNSCPTERAANALNC